MIIDGFKYVKSVYCSTIGKEVRWYASIEVKRRHRYSKRSAYGERMGWKHSRFIKVEGPRDFGAFDSKEAAMEATKAELKKRAAEGRNVTGRL